MSKKMKGIVDGEVDKLRQIKECKGHEWVGPSQEILWGVGFKFLYHCKHCPLAKLFDQKIEKE